MQVVKTGFTNDVVDYLDQHHTMTLSTSSFTGLPHANTALYVHDGTRITFLARHGSILLQNINLNRHAAFTIDDYSSQWGRRKELHGEGGCEPKAGSDLESVTVLWTAKYELSVPDGVLCDLSPTGLYFIVYDADSDEPAT